MRHSLRVVLAVVLQLGILVAIAGGRQWTLSTGTVVLLETAPVDPRDLFRGDYVVLSYKISTLGPSDLVDLGGVDPRFFQSRWGRGGEVIYVFLDQRGRFWTALALSSTRPSEGIFIRGRVLGPGAQGTIRIEYGIESYFVPEGTGRRLETSRESLEVEVALGRRDGTAVIRRLYVDGRPFP